MQQELRILMMNVFVCAYPETDSLAGKVLHLSSQKKIPLENDAFSFFRAYTRDDEGRNMLEILIPSRTEKVSQVLYTPFCIPKKGSISHDSTENAQTIAS
jgi:hypothetical protein